MDELSQRSLAACRQRIGAAHASAWEIKPLGTIVLRHAQHEAVMRVRTLLDRYRGCLLADDVGRGKTFVALAVARRWTRPLAVIPAALVDTWRLAMDRAGVAMPLVTHEALSRGGRPSFEPDGIVVDESHHFRNPGTLRYWALADVAIRAELLLLSATPVQNSAMDLAAQLRLFLGGAVDNLGPEEMSRFIVRVESDDIGAGLPRVVPPRWVHLPTDDTEVLECILRLPAPPRALDAGDAGVLRTIALVRAWASSRAALSSAVARRRRVATAIEQSIESGRIPTRPEADAWRGGGDDVVQLGFAPLLAAGGVADAVTIAVRDAVAAEHDALSELAALLRLRAGVDDARAAALASIADRHPGASVLAFTELSTTARAYHSHLRSRAGVGLLTASGGMIASGRLSRREILARFAPVAQGCPAPAQRERISLLVSTDLLSEGVNLQDASVVVHLDLPWNPARLSQRLGRVRRPHGAAEVASYLIAPPAGTEVLLEVESRLRDKLAEAQRTVAHGIEVVPALTLQGARVAVKSRAGPAALRATVHARLSEWAAGEPNIDEQPTHPIVGAAMAGVSGWIALLADGRLLASHARTVGEDIELVEKMTAAAGGAARGRPLDADELQRARSDIASWVQRDRALRDAGVNDLVSPLAQRTLRIATRCAHAAPRHERARYERLLARLRGASSAPLTLGAERALGAMTPEIHDGGVTCANWLDRVVTIVSRAPLMDGSRVLPDAAESRALILLGPEPRESP